MSSLHELIIDIITAIIIIIITIIEESRSRNLFPGACYCYYYHLLVIMDNIIDVPVIICWSLMERETNDLPGEPLALEPTHQSIDPTAQEIDY